jgi:hypothetical protein
VRCGRCVARSTHAAGIDRSGGRGPHHGGVRPRPLVLLPLAAVAVAGAVGMLALGGPAAVPLPWRSAGPEVVVLLGGDVHGEPPIAGVLARGGDPLAGVADALAAADLAVVNLETPVFTGPDAPDDKAITFRADPVLLERLAAAGVDVVSLANNHALDHGPDALAATVAAAREAGLAVVGAGPDAEAARAPAVVDVRGRRIAVVGLSDVVPDPSWEAPAAGGNGGWGIASALDHDAAAAAVSEAAAVADHVVVTVHWGLEFRDCPSVVQVELARRLFAAGADVVAGHHPHVVQGIDGGEGAPVVAYSLGNLAFYAATPETRDGLLLEARLSPEGTTARSLPVVIGDDGTPQLADGGDAARILERVRVRSPGGGMCPAAVWDGLPGRRSSALPDRGAEDPDALDLELHDVARPQVGVALAPVDGAELEDAAGPDGAGADDVAGADARVPARLGDQRPDRVVEVGELAARPLDPVDAGDHRRGRLLARAPQLVGGHEQRTERRGEVLALRGTEPQAHLPPLQVPGRQVVEDRVAGDDVERGPGVEIPRVAADDDGDLQLVVELLGGRRVHGLIGAEHGVGVREVEDRQLVPVRVDRSPAGRHRRGDVLLEGVEVPQGGRPAHRGAER